MMSKTIGPAIKERDAEPIRELARTQTAAGVDYLDLNIGPARKSGDELMGWLVNAVQEVSQLSLSLDTSNPVAMEAGLKVCQKRALVNSVSLQPERLEAGLPMVKKYDSDMVGLLWGVDGMPRDANERCMLTVDLVYRANETGIPNDKVWIDPIVTPVIGEITQLTACFEFMSMLGDIAPGCKSIVGLSNVSNGVPARLRPYLNRAFMAMLMKHGLYSAIVDAFDAELIKLARGGMPEILSLVHRMMDGDKPDSASLSQKELEYFKTVRVLKGETLYSDSWLEI
ncbi:MAG: dihydropteroate synthase [Dehalococcoidales bacterium]